MAKFLVVEDDPLVAQTVLDWLESEHHVGELAEDGPEGMDRLKLYLYDIAILDWQLPGITGLEICRAYRRQGGKTPILMLTGQSAIADKEAGLDAGADDYLTKPFHIRELAARVRALLRRPFDMVPSIQTEDGELRLDQKDFSLVYRQKKLVLQPKEFAVLDFLLRHQGQYFSAEQILNRVWKSESESTLDALRSCIKRLRQRIREESLPSFIQSARSYGYKFEFNAADSTKDNE